ncbi:MAG TPA: LysR substrate-binding domain-containing protein [Caulobacteraceae bacterium]|jgi:DNA-binding transcriptional LysR family regulator
MTDRALSPDLLRSYIAICEAGSFSGAARALGLRQSTVSQHLQKLESATGRRLIDRDTHRVRITPQGESVLEHARRVLEAHDEMARALSGAPLRGRLRFGASEDFVLSILPDVLAAFVRRHPDVDMELTVGLSEDLYAAFDAGDLDIIFVKRRVGDPRGVSAWREPLAWIGRPNYWLDPDTPVPLLVYPPPSVTRARAFATLDAARRSWRIAFTSGSLSALSAAARAGLGLMPHSARLMPPGLAAIAPGPGLPRLPEVEFAIIGPGGRDPVAEALTGVILQWAAYGSTAGRS